MYKPETLALRDTLANAAIKHETERRGFNTRKGVPDALVWVGPDIAGGHHCVPVLFELESIGGYHAAKDDVQKFASRKDDQNHRYHLAWPTQTQFTGDPVTINIQYQILAVPSASVTGEYIATEESFYDAVDTWATRRMKGAKILTSISSYCGIEVIWWQLTTRAFGFSLAVSIPIISSNEASLSSTEVARVIEQRARPSVTMFAVIDGRPVPREELRVYPTTVRFNQIPGSHQLSWTPTLKQ
ncbi:hypothetical protein [Haladaptatus sp. ZSTT2]|uniref:hypothetical protein n=1 Tax=Haladaptatus sp. ZSTT2 TaxID=3120515 RepID=UPI00300EBCF8